MRIDSVVSFLKKAGVSAFSAALVSGAFACAHAAEAAKADEPKVIIVGGGLAGLVAAYELQEKGISSHILEAKDRWGGRIATAQYPEGLQGEYGMHEVWERDPLYRYVRKLKIPLTKPEQAYSSVIIDGKLYPFIEDTYEAYLSKVFDPAERAEYGRWLKECEALYDEAEEKGLTPRLEELQKASYADWVGSFKLPAKVSEFIRLLIECEIATDWSRISALYGIGQDRIVLHGTEQCYHARGGNKNIVEAFVRAIRGPKTLGVTVSRIVHSRKADGTTEAVVYYSKGGLTRTLKAEKVVVAVPYHMLQAVQMEPTLSEEQWKAVETLIPGTYMVVHLVMEPGSNRSLLAEGKRFFPVLTRGPLGVVYGFLYPDRDSKKKEIFTLLIHGDHARTYLEPKDKIRERLLVEMDALWPGFSKKVQGAYFYDYHPVATPGWPVGRSPMDRLSESLREENQGLYLAGDYVYSSHAEGAVMSGQEVAKKIAASLKGAPPK